MHKRTTMMMRKSHQLTPKKKLLMTKSLNETIILENS